MRKIDCWCDGACEPKNPGGTMSCGMVIREGTNLLWSHGQIVKPKAGAADSERTNNCAEYAALWLLLQKLLAMGLQNEEITIYADSNLVIQQIWGDWAIKQGAYVSLAHKCREEVAKFSKMEGEWVPREENEEAGELSKTALRRAGVRIQKR